MIALPFDFARGIDILITIQTISLALCFIRLFLGPTLPNRIIAFDSIAIQAVGIIALFAINLGALSTLDATIVVAVLGFLGTTMMARYFERAAPRYYAMVQERETQANEIERMVEPIERAKGIDAMTTQEFGIFLLAATGVFFMVVSSVGVLRLPDVYARMHAASKATTLGIGGTLLAAGFFFGEWALLRMIILLLLFFITGPVATTAIARAAHRIDYDRELVLDYDELAVAEAKQRSKQELTSERPDEATQQAT